MFSKINPSEIEKIEYGEPEKINFYFRGEKITIKEPTDVILVGTDKDTAAKWIINHYGFILSVIDEK